MLMANKTARVSEAKGFQRMFAPSRLTLGVFFPIEAFEGDEPAMRGQERLARRAEELGFAALWFRDVPLRDPSFDDIGQAWGIKRSSCCSKTTPGSRWPCWASGRSEPRTASWCSGWSTSTGWRSSAGFLRLLSEHERARFFADVHRFLFGLDDRKADSDPPGFDVEWAQRWVTARAYSLG